MLAAPRLNRPAVILFVLLLAHVVAQGTDPPRALSPLETYPYAVGTQTFDPRYQFTRQTRLVETAQAMLDMGSNVVKFGMGRQLFLNVPELKADIQSLRDQAEREPSYRHVLEMPFAHYLIWAYPFSTPGFTPHATPDQLEREYREMYEFVTYLLRTYQGTGKAFYLGHWEGDWLLLGHTDDRKDPPAERIPAMIQWLNTRQKAVDDARRQTPHQGVQVFHYTEVNRVQRAIEGRPAMCNRVLPHVNVDMVSYSSYDSLGPDARSRLRKALDYIESQLPPKAGLPRKRVFIGEYGYPAQSHSSHAQADLSREVMAAGVEWGCPFVLYWEMYNNEIAEGKHRGFWLIDDQGRKQPAYHLHAEFLRLARQRVAGFHAQHRRLPDTREYWELMREFLEARARSGPAAE